MIVIISNIALEQEGERICKINSNNKNNILSSKWNKPLTFTVRESNTILVFAFPCAYNPDF